MNNTKNNAKEYNYIIKRIIVISLVIFILNLMFQLDMNLLRARNIFNPNFGWDEDYNFHLRNLTDLLGSKMTTGLTVTIPAMLSYKIFGEGIVHARFIVLIYLIIGLYSVYIISRNISGRLAGLLAVVFVATSLTMLTYGMWFIGEVPATTFMLLSIYFIIKNNKNYLFIAGIFGSLALITKPQMIVYPFGVLLYALIYKIDKKYLLSGFLAILVPYNILKFYYVGYALDFNMIFSFILSNNPDSYANRAMWTYIRNGGRLLLDNLVILIGIIHIKNLDLKGIFLKQEIGLLAIIGAVQILLFLFAPYGDRYGLAVIPLVSILLAHVLSIQKHNKA